MKAKNIELNKVYSVKHNPFYFKPIKVLNPKEEENTNNYIVVKGLYSATKDNFDFSIIKYFKPTDLYLKNNK